MLSPSERDDSGVKTMPGGSGRAVKGVEPKRHGGSGPKPAAKAPPKGGSGPLDAVRPQLAGHHADEQQRMLSPKARLLSPLRTRNATGMDREALRHHQPGEGVHLPGPRGHWNTVGQVSRGDPAMAQLGDEYKGEKQHARFRDDEGLEDAVATGAMTEDQAWAEAQRGGRTFRGWRWFDGEWVPVRTYQHPAPRDLQVGATGGVLQHEQAAMDTTGAQPGLADAGQDRKIFVMGRDRNLYSEDAKAATLSLLRQKMPAVKAARDQARAAGKSDAEISRTLGAGNSKVAYEYFHHSSFLPGDEVAAAGDMEVKQGYLKNISNESGHFRPGRAQHLQALERLDEMGVELGTAKTQFTDAEGRHAGPTGKGYNAGEYLQSGGNLDLLHQRHMVRGQLEYQQKGHRRALDADAEQRAARVGPVAATRSPDEQAQAELALEQAARGQARANAPQERAKSRALTAQSSARKRAAADALAARWGGGQASGAQAPKASGRRRFLPKSMG